MIVGRNIKRLLLLLLSSSLLIPGVVVAGVHDKAYGMEAKMSLLRMMMMVLSWNCCKKRKAVVGNCGERERLTNCRREGVVGASVDANDSFVHHEDANKLGLL